MTRKPVHAVLSLLRIVSLVIASSVCLTVFMRCAPGYFSDSRELNAEHAGVVRQQIQAQQQQQSSLGTSMRQQWNALRRADLGQSKQFDVPVSRLIAERSGATAKLLAASVLCAWGISLGCALPLALRRTHRGETLVAAPVAILLAVPVGAMATICLLTDFGGPVLVLTLILAARDFKLVYRLLRHLVRSPSLLFARSQGLSTLRIVRAYLLPTAIPETGRPCIDLVRACLERMRSTGSHLRPSGAGTARLDCGDESRSARAHWRDHADGCLHWARHHGS
jgi:peptide/nickel transport system permease protein